MTDDERDLVDVLEPAETVAGIDGVRALLARTRRVWLVSDPDELAPVRLSKREARALLDRYEAGGEVDGPDGVRPVLVTARVEGPDAVIRALEWMGDASQMGRPRDPRVVADRVVKRGRSQAFSGEGSAEEMIRICVAGAWLAVVVLLGACAGDPAPESPGVEVDPTPVGSVEPLADGAGVLPRGRDLRWYVSRGRRALDDLENVVVYRSADDVSGSPDVVLYARCLGDRTEVEIDMGVALGDDVVGDGDLRTKRVLVRFPPADLRPMVFEVGSRGRSLVVDPPLDFLRRLVEADSVILQTLSARGTAVFADFVVTALAYQNLSIVSQTCGWILDPVEVVRLETQRQAALFEIERAEVMDTYVGVPIRDGFERFGVEYDELYLDLPAPVGRAYLGLGVSISAVEIAIAQGLGIVCVSGAWVADEIVLRECYIEGHLAAPAEPGDVDGLGGDPR